MNRSTLPRLLRLVALATFSVLTLTGATGKPIHPSTLGTGGPILIAVVGDHYLEGDEDEFNYDVDNFLKRGLLLDAYYKERKDDWRFVSYFEPTAAGQESRYGFKIGFGQGNCAVLDDQVPGKTTTELLNGAVGSDVPRHTIVIGNHPYNFGCSKGNWTYVAVGAVATDVLQHEFGHRIAYLWDEWFPETTTAPPSYVTAAAYKPPTWSPGDTRNCWPKGTGEPTPHWELNPVFKNFTNPAGCDQVAAGVVHPYDHCRMGTSHARMFCDVCKAEMDKSFAELVEQANAFAGPGGTGEAANASIVNLRASHSPAQAGFRIANAAFVVERQPVPPPAAPQTRPVLKVVIRYTPDQRVVNIRQVTNGSGQYVPNYRRSGQYMYEVKDGSNIVDIGVIPDQLFEAHGSRGGAPHTTTKLETVDLVVMIPDRTVESLGARPLQVVFYKIPTNVTDRTITRASFPKLRAGGGFESWGQMTLSTSP